MALINQKPEDIENSLWVLKLKIKALEKFLTPEKYKSYNKNLMKLKNQVLLNKSNVKLTFYDKGVKIGI